MRRRRAALRLVLVESTQHDHTARTGLSRRNAGGLRTAVDAGAHSVYAASATRPMRVISPVSISTRRDDGRCGLHPRPRAKILIASTPSCRRLHRSVERGVDDAVAAGADALILADVGLVDYARKTHPKQRLHLSSRAAATPRHRFLSRSFRHCAGRAAARADGRRNARLTSHAAPCETEVFVFGGLCVMAEGRCMLSSYATGKSPNMTGVCSPPSHVSYREESDALVASVGGFTVERFERGEPAGYPTLCKGASRRKGRSATCSKIRSASTPSSCCRASPNSASPPSRSKGASAGGPISPRGARLPPCDRYDGRRRQGRLQRIVQPYRRSARDRWRL